MVFLLDSASGIAVLPISRQFTTMETAQSASSLH
jgi:hypothetical protein